MTETEPQTWLLTLKLSGPLDSAELVLEYLLQRSLNTPGIHRVQPGSARRRELVMAVEGESYHVVRNWLDDLVRDTGQCDWSDPDLIKLSEVTRAALVRPAAS